MASVVELEGDEELVGRLRGCAICVVMFYDPKCPVCRKYLPVFEGVVGSRQWPGVAFYKVSTKTLSKELKQRLNIVAVPTLVVFIGGEEYRREEGGLEATEVEELLKSLPAYIEA